MAGPFQAWRNVFSKHKPRSIRGAYWYRAVTKGRRETILAMDGAFLYGGRYNKAEEFGALYLSESKEGCEAEVSRRPAGPKHYLVGKIKVDLSRVCDLTDKALMQQLGLDIEQLTVDGWEQTQIIGKLVREAGFEGLIVPSAAGDFCNLVVFIDQLSDESAISLEEIEKLEIEP